tara:strand:+ start:16107 stop:20180 length:4074 start_codon:yes stop_codon:yes gene_type:complete
LPLKYLFAFFYGLYFILPSTLFSAPLSLERISIEQGLSQSTVYAITQDQLGYIWLGTGDGIDLYDGYSITHLRNKPNDITSLSGNYVKALLVGSDGNIWVGTLGGGLNRYDPESRTFIRYLSEISDAQNIASKDIYSLYESKEGLIWIGSEQGASVFNPQDNSFKHFSYSSNIPTTINNGPIRAITQTTDGTMWFGSSQSGISSLSKDSNHFKHIKHLKDEPSSLSNNAINALYQDKRGNLWIGTEYGGLNKLDINTRKITRYTNSTENELGLNDSEVTSFFEDDKGGLWLGTWSGGLNYFNPVTEHFEHHKYSLANSGSISSNTVISLFEDHSGMLWAGTFDNGVNIIDYQEADFEHYRHDPLLNEGLVDKMIWAISEDDLGKIWIGTKNGLSRFSPDNGKFTSYFKEGRCTDNPPVLDIRSILADNNALWIGTAGGGLMHFNPQDCKAEYYLHDESNANALSDNHVRLLLKDNQQHLWIGTRNGLNKLDLSTGKIKRYKSNQDDKSTLPHNRIRSLYQDNEGTIWIGTSGGLSRYNTLTDNFDNFTAEQGLLSENDVRAIWKDIEGIFWIATGNGLTRLNLQQKKAQFFYEQDGLANNTLYSLLIEGEYLWITTNNGLSRFNRQDFSFANFDISDGLQSNEFNINAALKSKPGYFYIGGINGFNRFLPEKLNSNKTLPKMNVKLHTINKTIYFPLKNEQQVVSLDASDPKLTFTISVMHYLNSHKNEFEYQLSGYDKHWIRMEAKNKIISYSSLPFGDYEFKIRAYASNGLVGKQMNIPIVLTPPMWRTWWANAFYLIALLLLINSLLHLRTKELKRKSNSLQKVIKEKTQELELKNNHLNEKTQELSALLKNQDDFYLGVAHELRTPLTLTQMSAERLLTMDLPPRTQNNLNIILNATSRQKSLTEQMFQAATKKNVLQAGVVTLDLSAHILSITHIYELAAQEKNIEYTVQPTPKCAITINKQVLESTLHNLLSNAIRYTPTGGKVSVLILLREDGLQINIKDNGIGLSKIEQKNIFNRFVRTERAQEFSSEGDGVGLYTVSKSLNQCGGNITVSSEEGKGSTFSAYLPCQFTMRNTALLPVEHNSDSDDTNLQKEKPSLLIIEDDPDIRELLGVILEDQYQVTLTGSAKQGLLQAQEMDHDIVLCDVMLPDGNGFEITRELKSNDNTAHIPLILLTAVADMAGHKTGWDNGADDYIVKPFTTDDLLHRIAAVLNNRKRLQKWYLDNMMQKPDTENNEPLVDNIQLQYVNELHQVTQTLIESRQCNLENIAEAMNQNIRTLQRRIKSLLGCSVTDYIKSAQLNRAKELLEQGHLVKEAAYKVGFSDPAHFGKLFKKQFSKTPGEYRKPFIKPR